MDCVGRDFWVVVCTFVAIVLVVKEMNGRDVVDWMPGCNFVVTGDVVVDPQRDAEVQN